MYEQIIYVTDGMIMDRNTSVPKSVLRYVVDKVTSLDLETNLSQSYSEVQGLSNYPQS